LPDRLIDHNSQAVQLDEAGLSARAIAQMAIGCLDKRAQQTAAP
jgi:hypothetical protein